MMTFNTLGESVTRVGPNIYSVEEVRFAAVRVVDISTMTTGSSLATYHSVRRKRTFHLDGDWHLVLHNRVGLAIRDLDNLRQFLRATTRRPTIRNVFDETELPNDLRRVVLI